jgi:hypothetical protein
MFFVLHENMTGLIRLMGSLPSLNNGISYGNTDIKKAMKKHA